MTASQESNEELMQELKGKAEFFQQYIMERFRKLHEQRSVATSTDELESDQYTTNTEKLVENCDEDIAAKVRLLGNFGTICTETVTLHRI